MWFELADYDAYKRRVFWVRGHETQLAPLVKEISVDIDTIRLTQILRNEGSNRRQVLLFEGMLVLDVSQF